MSLCILSMFVESKKPNQYGEYQNEANKYFQKEVGAWNYLQIMEGLEAFTLALFTREAGYTVDEVKVICANIRKEIKDPKMHVMFYLHVAYGQKPESSAAS